MQRRSTLLFLITGLVLAGLALPDRATRAQATAQTQTFEAVADAYVHSGQPTANSGTEYHLRVGYDGEEAYRSLVRFDLDDIPRDAVIESAELRLYLYQPGLGADSSRIEARMVYGSWSESSVNWGNQPGSGSPAASKNVGKSQAWNTWNVRSAVQGWVDRRFSNRGFMLRADNETQNAMRVFAAREAPPPVQPPTFRAKLVVTWSVATPTPTLSPTSTRTPTPTPSATLRAGLTPTVTPTPAPGYRDVGIVRVWADQFADEGGYTVARGNVRIGANGQSPPAGGLLARLRRWLVPVAHAGPPAVSNFTAGDATRWPAGGPIDVQGQLAFEANSRPLLESVGPGTLSVDPATGNVTYTTARPLVTTLGDTYLRISPTLEVNVIEPVAKVKGDVLLNLPENAGITAYVEFQIDGQGNFEGKSSIDLNLVVAGGNLTIEDLRPQRDGLKADSATYTLPQFGNLEVALKDIVIDATPDGKGRLSFAGIATFDLPDIDLGNGVFVLTGRSGQKLKGSLAIEQPAGGGPTRYKIALTGALKLNLPWQRGDTRIDFTDLAISNGGVTGRIQATVKIDLLGKEDLELGPFNLNYEVAATAERVNGGSINSPHGLASPALFSYTLKPDWTRLDLSDKLGLPPGTTVVQATDVTLMTVAPYVRIGSVASTFNWPGPVGIGPAPYVLAFKNIRGQVAYDVDSGAWSMTWITNVEFNLEAVTTVANLALIVDRNGLRLTNKVPSIAVGVAGLILELKDADFKAGTFTAQTGSLKLPASWGGDAFAINDVRIDKDGLHLGGAGGEVALPDRTIGSVLELTGLRSRVMVRTSDPDSGATRTLYTVGITGTVKIALADQITGGASFGGSFRDGRFRGQVDGINFQLSGFGFQVEHGDWEGDEIRAETFQMGLPGRLFGSSGNVGLTLHNLTIGGPKGFAFDGGEVALPDFAFAGVGFQKVRIGFERAGDRYRVAGGAKINLQTFAVDGTFTIVYEPPGSVALEQVALAFKGSVAGGTAIPIVPGALYVTEVRGSFDLRSGTTVISYGGTLAGPLEVANLPVYSAAYDTTVTLKPCCRYLFVAKSKILILEVDRTVLEISTNPRFVRFERSARLPDYLTRVTVTMVMGMDENDKFTMWGALQAKVGIDKGEFGTYAGAPIPPRDVTLAEAELAAGKFHKEGGGERWGARLKFKVAGVKLYAFYNFDSGRLSGGLARNNPYEGVPVETRLADSHIDRLRFTVGPASQIVVAEAITTTSQTGEFGLQIEPPGGSPSAPPVVYQDDRVTLYAIDDPVAGDWYVTVPRGNAVELTGIAPDPAVSDLTVTEGTPVSINWRVDGAGPEATARLTAVNQAGQLFPIAETLPLAGSYTWLPIVPNGTYTITLEAGGLDEAPATATAGPILVNDTQPPAAPADLTVAPSPDGSALIRWNAEAIEPDVVGYHVIVDGVEQPPVAQRIAQHAVSGFAPGTTHTVAVRAYDIAGHVGPEAAATVAMPAFFIEALSPAPDSQAVLTPDVRATLNQPAAIIELTVTDGAGNPAPGHLARLTYARSDGTTVVYGARFVADGVWPAGTYTASVRAESATGEVLLYTWSWRGAYYSTYLPLAVR